MSVIDNAKGMLQAAAIMFTEATNERRNVGPTLRELYLTARLFVAAEKQRAKKGKGR